MGPEGRHGSCLETALAGGEDYGAAEGWEPRDLEPSKSALGGGCGIVPAVFRPVGVVILNGIPFASQRHHLRNGL